MDLGFFASMGNQKGTTYSLRWRTGEQRRWRFGLGRLAGQCRSPAKRVSVTSRPLPADVSPGRETADEPDQERHKQIHLLQSLVLIVLTPCQQLQCSLTYHDSWGPGPWKTATELWLHPPTLGIFSVCG